MIANYREPKKKPPRAWNRLRKVEQDEIIEFVRESLEELTRINLDHEEAELQKTWLQYACIVLHRQKDRYGKMRCMAFLKDWKRVYRISSKFKTAEERDAWLKSEMEKIFGKDGYPHEWVDSLENGGRGDG